MACKASNSERHIVRITQFAELDRRISCASNKDLKGLIFQVKDGEIILRNHLMLTWFLRRTAPLRRGHWDLLYVTARLDRQYRKCKRAVRRKRNEPKRWRKQELRFFREVQRKRQLMPWAA